MKCPECQTENPETRKFCRKCGEKLLIICPQCDFENLPEDKFCGECGQKLDEAVEKEVPEAEGERKYVTVLFSDLSGYTAMSEKLDPEELKEITSRIFGEISNVINKALRIRREVRRRCRDGSFRAGCLYIVCGLNG